MTPKQFVAQQLALPMSFRILPDLLYVRGSRLEDLETLRAGQQAYNANGAFRAAIYYERADYFGPNGTGRHRYYPNGIFSL